MIYTVASIPRYLDTAQYNLYSAGENCESWAELSKCTTDNLFSSHVFLLNLLLKYKFTLQDQQFQILRFSSVAMWWDGWGELWTIPREEADNILHPSDAIFFIIIIIFFFFFFFFLWIYTGGWMGLNDLWISWSVVDRCGSFLVKLKASV